jgi:site-specific recombinase XerD
MTSLAPILQSFFTDRLMTQRQASPNTVSAYRDTFRLLLAHACAKTGKAASALDMADIDADCVACFLAALQHERGNSVRTRNARLAAIHSFFAYAALRCPEHAGTIQRVLAIPTARVQRNTVTYLDDDETAAFLSACDQDTWTGRRDHAMFTLAIQTGLRVSELIGLAIGDIRLGAGAHVRCLGKGRKQRSTPLTTGTAEVLRAWIRDNTLTPDRPLFPTSTGRPLSRDAVERRIAVTSAKAALSCESLANKKTTAHALRHTAAMRLLHAGVDVAVIALWLGHEQIATTNIYLHADMRQKEEAIARTGPLGPTTTTDRYKPDDTLLRFLTSL